MKLWKRNAVVAAIVLFVCVAVYLNWSYHKDNNADAGKTLGEAALVGSQTDDPLLTGSTVSASPSPSPSAGAERRDLRPADRGQCVGDGEQQLL